jgi:hypothetical protein
MSDKARTIPSMMLMKVTPVIPGLNPRISSNAKGNAKNRRSGEEVRINQYKIPGMTYRANCTRTIDLDDGRNCKSTRIEGGRNQRTK